MEAQPKAITNTGGIEGEPVHVALAGMVLPNDPSTALRCKLGFTEVGNQTGLLGTTRECLVSALGSGNR